MVDAKESTGKVRPDNHNCIKTISSYGLPHSYKDQIPQTSYKVTTKITIGVDIQLAKKEIDGTQFHRFFLNMGKYAVEEKYTVSQHWQDT